MATTAVATGRAPFRDWETWYRVTGTLGGGRPPLVVLHGGPGATHDYLLPLADLATSDRAVIHYDQLGSGNSTHLQERGSEFWTVELFLDQLDALLSVLGVEAYHLLGQSWGGMLAAEHAVRQPVGLRGLVLSNSPASMPLWISEAARLRAGLPAETRAVLDRHEAAGTTEDPEYLTATQAYYDRHLCRLIPNPPELARTLELLAADPTVYRAMNGPNEFFCIGSLRTWTIVDRVRAITAPTLLISGRHDEATPATVQPFADTIPNVRWELFEASSHSPFLEERDRYLQVVGTFLDEND